MPRLDLPGGHGQIRAGCAGIGADRRRAGSAALEGLPDPARDVYLDASAAAAVDEQPAAVAEKHVGARRPRLGDLDAACRLANHREGRCIGVVGLRHDDRRAAFERHGHQAAAVVLDRPGCVPDRSRRRERALADEGAPLVLGNAPVLAHEEPAAHDAAAIFQERERLVAQLVVGARGGGQLKRGLGHAVADFAPEHLEFARQRAQRIYRDASRARHGYSFLSGCTYCFKGKPVVLPSIEVRVEDELATADKVVDFYHRGGSIDEADGAAHIQFRQMLAAAGLGIPRLAILVQKPSRDREHAAAVHRHVLEALDSPHHRAAGAHHQAVAAQRAEVAAADQAPPDCAGDADEVVATLTDVVQRIDAAVELPCQIHRSRDRGSRFHGQRGVAKALDDGGAANCANAGAAVERDGGGSAPGGSLANQVSRKLDEDRRAAGAA